MKRIKLRIDKRRYRAETFLTLHRIDGVDERLLVIVDTGAQTSLLPRSLLAKIDHRLSERGTFILEQAGIAHQTFEAVEAVIKLSLEDGAGGDTGEFEAPVWFSDTDRLILGFRGVLERAILHLDMPNLSGYLDFPD
jgi:hypothetical protein